MRQLWVSAAGLCLLGAGTAFAETGIGAVWEVSSVNGIALVSADDVTFEFDAGRIFGRSGCNRFSAGVSLVATTPATGSLTLDPVMSTRMACRGRGDQVEGMVLPALDAVTEYEIDATGELVLKADGVAVLRARRR